MRLHEETLDMEGKKNPDPENVTKEESVIKQYDGSFNPNWNTYRIYSILDILTSPMRQIAINKLEQERKTREEYTKAAKGEKGEVKQEEEKDEDSDEEDDEFDS